MSVVPSGSGNGLSTPAPQAPAPLKDEIALCLSGGGYRAMVFHMGALLRLNDAGLLSKLARVSSVSGGSITAAVLALKWDQLQFDANGVAQRLDLVLSAITAFAKVTVDAGAVIKGILLPGTVNDRVVAAYEEHLFGKKTLQDLPDPNAGKPCFVINATSVQTGDLWRFEREYMGDYKVGLFRNPTVSLAKAVAASSAFPPVLSPATLDINEPVESVEGATLGYEPYTKTAVLSDGGVYDNMGLENPWKQSKTILVSDGGQDIGPDPKPAHDWAQHSIRVLEIIDHQVRALRRRYLIDAYIRGDHNGTFWGISSDFKNYPLAGKADPLGRAGRNPQPLAQIPTRLAAMDDPTQQKLMNWGYAICDAALASHWGDDLAKKYGAIKPAERFPFAVGY